MAADELAARRWFRQRLDKIGAQYPKLRTPEAQERLAGELARQEEEGEAMAETIRRGRPKGSKSAVVELKTLSFKIAAGDEERLRQYASVHGRSVSDVIRDSLPLALEGSGPVPQPDGGGQERYDSNTRKALEEREGETLREIQASLARLEAQIHTLTQRLDLQLLQSNDKDHTSNTKNVEADLPASMVPRVKVDKATVIARIRQMHETGLDSTQIAKQLQAEATPTLSGKGVWHPGTVRKLLLAT